jgi:hypothetical protein
MHRGPLLNPPPSLPLNTCNNQTKHTITPGKHLNFDVELVTLTSAANLDSVVFGAGCFWGPQLAFDRVPGAGFVFGGGLSFLYRGEVRAGAVCSIHTSNQTRTLNTAPTTKPKTKNQLAQASSPPRWATRRAA